MRFLSPALWLQKLSVLRKFYVIISLIILILLFGLASFTFSLRTMSGIRAYVGGEGLWSKAQKEALNSLSQYAHSHNESDYDNFLKFLNVPLGDKQARLELEKSNPDLSLVRVGFLKGENHPDDFSDMIFLFRDFRHVSYMAQAIDIWTQGDEQIEELLNIGRKVHDAISNSSSGQDASPSKLATLLSQAQIVDMQVSILENRFSSILGEGSRAIGLILLIAFMALSSIIGAMALLIAMYIGRTIDQVDRAKSEFVSLASHQLRTPLTAIGWSVERLLNDRAGPTNQKQHEYFVEIQENNQRMIHLVNSILKVSKIELGGFIIEPVRTDIRMIVKDILAEVAPQVLEKRIKVEELYPREPLLVPVDTELFRVVIQNLIQNAITYSEANSAIHIRVRVLNKGETMDAQRFTNDSFVLQVADSGIGIPKDQQGKIFTKLFRANNAILKKTDGNGLGLYISKVILDNSGGSIWFISEVGKGTTFNVALPLQGMKSKKTFKELV